MTSKIIAPLEGKVFGPESDEEFDGFAIMGEVASQFEFLKSRMKERVIGQDQAIDTIVAALDASHIRTKNERGPIAVLAFLGPTGVGKTETARALTDTLAEMLGEEEGNLVKIDASDYQHGHEVSKLFGSPPGYVGSKIKPMFSPKRIERPATVVLIDEVEKGAAELHNQLLHVMDDGKVNLNNGKKTDFSNTILILTGNVGGSEMSKALSGKPSGFASDIPQQPIEQKALDSIALKDLEKSFPPEFINRLSEIVVFHPLDREKMGTLLDAKIATLNDEYVDAYGVRVVLSDSTRERLLDATMLHPELAGRELARVLKKHVQTDLGRYIGGNHVSEGTLVQVFHRDEPVIRRQIAESDPREYIFAQRRDESIRKKRIPIAELPAAEKSVAVGSALIEFSDKPINQ